MTHATFPLPPLATGDPENAGPRWLNLAQPRVAGMATYEWNAVTGISWYSEEWENIIRCPYDWTRPSDQEWWSDRVHPEDKQTFQRTLLAIYAGLADAYNLLCRFRRGDGVWMQLLFRSQVSCRTPEGGPWIISGVVMDLTDVLPRGSEASVTPFSGPEYHAMLENSPDLFIRFNRELTPVYVNPTVCRYLGGARKGRAFHEQAEGRRLVGGYRPLFRRYVEQVFEKKAVVRAEVCLAMTDGSEIAGECSFWPEFNAAGEVRYAMVQFRDITEKRRMEERAALNEKRLEALYKLTMMEDAPGDEVLHFVMDSMLEISRSPSGFFFIPDEPDSDRGRLLWSRDHYSLAGRRYLPDGRLPKDLIMQMTGENGVRMRRIIYNSEDGSPRYVAFGGKLRVMCGIITSITEEKAAVCIAGVCNKDSDYEESDLQQLETFIASAWLILRRRKFVRELRIAKDAAESANTAKNAFLANVSHELRTPLNGVLSMLQFIDAMPLAKEQREYLQTAQVSGKALLRIISDILDYSGMESGKMSLTEESFDFQAVVCSALRMFADSAASRGLAFSFSIDPAIPLRLLGDEARVRQVFFNVVGNAFKFTAEGSVAVSCARIPAVAEGRARIAVTVADTGIGIPRDKLESIFEAFSQVENTHRRRYAGNGLGLGIVKHLVAMMDGSVRVESELDKGTEVHIELEFAVAPPSAVRRAGPEPDRETGPDEPLDILVVEDDSVGSMAIRVFLERRGHRVVCVEDGGKALEALQVYPFHCVFTDITMPVVDGLELVRRIRALDIAPFPPSGVVRERVAAVFPEGAGSGRSRLPGMAKMVDTAGLAGVTVVAVSAHSMIGDREKFLEQGMDYYISKPIDKDELDGALAFVARKRRGA